MTIISKTKQSISKILIILMLSICFIGLVYAEAQTGVQVGDVFYYDHTTNYIGVEPRVMLDWHDLNYIIAENTDYMEVEVTEVYSNSISSILRLIDHNGTIFQTGTGEFRLNSGASTGGWDFYPVNLNEGDNVWQDPDDENFIVKESGYWNYKGLNREMNKIVIETFATIDDNWKYDHRREVFFDKRTGVMVETNGKFFNTVMFYGGTGPNSNDVVYENAYELEFSIKLIDSNSLSLETNYDSPEQPEQPSEPEAPDNSAQESNEQLPIPIEFIIAIIGIVIIIIIVLAVKLRKKST